jgi:hypothetical protein
MQERTDTHTHLGGLTKDKSESGDVECAPVRARLVPVNSLHGLRFTQSHNS